MLFRIRGFRIYVPPWLQEFSSDSSYDSVPYDPVKTRSSESKTEAEEPTNHDAWNRAV